MINASKTINRRRFILSLSVIGTAAAIGGAAALKHGAFADGDADGNYQTVGKTSDFRVGDFTRVALSDGANVYVSESGEKPGTYVALSSRCTHKGCEVLWIPNAKKFRCPCHGGVFDATGLNVSGPPPSPLASLKTKVQDGGVLVMA